MSDFIWGTLDWIAGVGDSIGELLAHFFEWLWTVIGPLLGDLMAAMPMEMQDAYMSAKAAAEPVLAQINVLFPVTEVFQLYMVYWTASAVVAVIKWILELIPG